MLKERSLTSSHKLPAFPDLDDGFDTDGEDSEVPWAAVVEQEVDIEGFKLDCNL